MPIIGKRLTIIKKNGVKLDYTHITHIETCIDETIVVEGETDLDGMRAEILHKFPIEDVHIVIFEPYKVRI